MPVMNDTVVWTYPKRSLVSQFAAVAVRMVARPVIAMWARLPGLLWPFGALELFAAVLPAVRGVTRHPAKLPNCGGEWIVPESGRQAGVILYLHGGAFLVGGIRSHRRLVSRLVKATGVPALSLNYRQLPGSPASQSLADSLDGLEEIVASGVPIDQIVVVGDSAGAYLAVRTVLAAQRTGLGSAAGLGCLSPIFDPDPAFKLEMPNADKDPLFPPSALRTMWQQLLAAETDPVDLAGLREIVTVPSAVLAALPPVLIQVGAEEVLRPDADCFAAYSSAAGGDVRLELYPGQVHVFHIAADILPEARIALSRMSAHITNCLAPARSVAA